ncbi:MAG: vitamin K epoxide reductase family protein [Patescibacteria group bacterium]
MLPKWTPVIAAIAFVGLADALYLTAHHYFGVPLACGPFSGCETVTSSVYSVVLGIPVALPGALYYLAMFFGILLAWEYKSLTYFRYICLFSICGVFASAWFLFVMAFLLHAWCTYCLVSVATSTLLFGLCMYGLHVTKPQKTVTSTKSLDSIPNERTERF